MRVEAVGVVVRPYPKGWTPVLKEVRTLEPGHRFPYAILDACSLECERALRNA
jgi:hypothetical protein